MTAAAAAGPNPTGRCRRGPRHQERRRRVGGPLRWVVDRSVEVLVLHVACVLAYTVLQVPRPFGGRLCPRRHCRRRRRCRRTFHITVFIIEITVIIHGWLWLIDCAIDCSASHQQAEIWSWDPSSSLPPPQPPPMIIAQDCVQRMMTRLGEVTTTTEEFKLELRDDNKLTFHCCNHWIVVAPAAAASSNSISIIFFLFLLLHTFHKSLSAIFGLTSSSQSLVLIIDQCSNGWCYHFDAAQSW